MNQIKIRNIIGIIVGAAIFSFGFVHFNMQNQLGEGGFSGITLILYFTLNWDPALLNILLNIPMFVLGWKILGKRSLIYTLVGTIAVSVFIKLFKIYEIQMNMQNDMLLVSLFAGVFVGAGLGVVFRFGGTTGGADILVRIAHKYLGWSMGKTMFGIDVLVILISWITFLNERSMMYTLVAVYVGGRVIDIVQDGATAAKGALIISEKSDEIANFIAEKMERGITIFDAHGHYTKEHKNVIYCVVPKNELVRIKTIAQTIDPHAFVSILDVRDVSGEGFTLDDKKQPIH